MRLALRSWRDHVSEMCCALTNGSNERRLSHLNRSRFPLVEIDNFGCRIGACCRICCEAIMKSVGYRRQWQRLLSRRRPFHSPNPLSDSLSRLRETKLCITNPSNAGIDSSVVWLMGTASRGFRWMTLPDSFRGASPI